MWLGWVRSWGRSCNRRLHLSGELLRSQVLEALVLAYGVAVRPLGFDLRLRVVQTQEPVGVQVFLPTPCVERLNRRFVGRHTAPWSAQGPDFYTPASRWPGS